MATRTSTLLDAAAVSRLASIEYRARFIVEGFITGLHPSPYHGFSVEFAEHRQYQPGESLKNIDWKVYGRTDKLYVRRYEEETNLRCTVCLDVSDSMRYPTTQKPNKLDYSANLAASLAYLMILQKDAAGMLMFDDRIRFHAPPYTRYSRLLPIFAQLEAETASEPSFERGTSTAQVLHQLAAKIPRRGVVVLVTDLFGGQTSPEVLVQALQHLRHQKHEVIIFQVRDSPTEDAFDFPNRPLIVKDLETGQELNVQPEQVKAAYQAEQLRRLSFLRQRCRELQVDLVEADLQTPYDRLLRSYLIRRRMLYR